MVQRTGTMGHRENPALEKMHNAAKSDSPRTKSLAERYDVFRELRCDIFKTDERLWSRYGGR
jgi:hypothetical protein